MGLDTHRVSNKVSKITSRHLVPLDRAFPAHALVHDSKLTVNDPNPAASHRPILYDSGRPSSVIWGRVGLASELTARGASTTEVMLAGNWKTARMVAHYSAGATAERGAVARYL